MSERLITVDVRIREFDNDGREVFTASLVRQGKGSHLTGAERVVLALEALAAITDDEVTAP